jgi:hypothetical protein
MGLITIKILVFTACTCTRNITTWMLRRSVLLLFHRLGIQYKWNWNHVHWIWKEILYVGKILYLHGLMYSILVFTTSKPLNKPSHYWKIFGGIVCAHGNKTMTGLCFISTAPTAASYVMIYIRSQIFGNALLFILFIAKRLHHFFLM